MARYNFSKAERWAVHKVHGDKCYMCGCVLTLKTMEVDHMLPESLLDKPDELARCLYEYGLPSTLNLNSFENWLPACGPCNNTKRAKPFRPTPIIQSYLDKARALAPQAAKIAAQAFSDKKFEESLGAVFLAVEQGTVSKERIVALSEQFVALQPET